MFQLISGVEVNDNEHDEENENTFMVSLSLAKRLSKRMSDKETCTYFSTQ